MTNLDNPWDLNDVVMRSKAKKIVQSKAEAERKRYGPIVAGYKAPIRSRRSSRSVPLARRLFLVVARRLESVRGTVVSILEYT